MRGNNGERKDVRAFHSVDLSRSQLGRAMSANVQGIVFFSFSDGHVRIRSENVQTEVEAPANVAQTPREVSLTVRLTH